MEGPTLVYLGVGANVGDARRTIDRAAFEVSDAATWLLRRAPLFRTAPVGPIEQPDFLNTVFEVSTTRTPADLLARLKAIEVALGRETTQRWGPRAIDLDILLFGERRVSADGLRVPHRELSRRRFVLDPLATLCPDRVVPGIGRTVRALLDDVGEQQADRVA